MATTTTINHKCGHKGVIAGHKSETTLAWLGTQSCLDCKYRMCVQIAAKNRFPGLTGTDKQKRWATVVRHDVLVAITNELMACEADGSVEPKNVQRLRDMWSEYFKSLLTRHESVWWIDKRANTDLFVGRVRELAAEAGVATT